jgi:hypothetical protein
MKVGECVAWGLFNCETRKLVGGRGTPYISGTKLGVENMAVGRNEVPVRVRIVPILDRKRARR